MLLEITYSTQYRYEPPVRNGLTALRLRPRPRPGIDVSRAIVSVVPGRVVRSYTDAWGTNVDLVECPGLHGTITFDLQASVQTRTIEQDIPPTPDEWSLFTSESARVRFAPVIPLGWNVPGSGATWTAVESALAWIPQRFIYQVGATDAETQIEEVVENGYGVCQDFAHIFLAILRAWGWCARYVSGYFFNADSDSERIDAEAMHAWVEVYRKGAGWVGLDCTAGQLADDRYVPVAYGRDYDDVRPVRGVIRGYTIQSQTSHLGMRQQQQ